MAERATQAKASSVTLEEFLDVANKAVMRAIQAEGLAGKPWPHGPITVGIIYMPPELRGQVGGGGMK